MRDARLRVDLGRPLRQQAVARHRVEDARLAVLEHEQHRAHRDHRAEAARSSSPSAGPATSSACASGSRRAQLLVRHEPGGDEADDHVDQRADRQPAEDADRQVALRILRLLGRRGDRVEADVGEEDDRRALVDAAPAVRRERDVVRRVDVHRAHDDEQRQHQQLHHDHDVVRPRALLHAAHAAAR